MPRDQQRKHFRPTRADSDVTAHPIIQVHPTNQGSDVSTGFNSTNASAFLHGLRIIFNGFVKGYKGNGWRDGQGYCPDVDKELWRLGPDGSGFFLRKENGGEEKKKQGKRTRESEEERTEETEKVWREERVKPP
ncbi:hypothetical protein TNCV_3380121 [Trichonephila clavipes]|nr:hypothetical protein TNCV_3380121 [Trichonephila clavipes]